MSRRAAAGVITPRRPAADTDATCCTPGRPAPQGVEPNGPEDDAAFFARNPGRKHRCRFPVGCERRLAKSGLPRGVTALVVVRQIMPGMRARAFIGWRGALPDFWGGETFAAAGFENATRKRRQQ